jgi:uncharacterized iron-regulated membrane protein
VSNIFKAIVMARLRKFVFWIHLIAGITVGLAIASMALTGSIMAFERPIVAWAERTDPAASAPPQGVKANDESKVWQITSLVRVAMQAVPDASPSAVTAETDLGRPLAVQFGREQVVYLNNFTGKIVGIGALRLRSFFATVEQLHRYLALQGDWRSWGQIFSGTAALVLVFMILSGLCLWMPRVLRWSSFRQVLLFNFRLKGKARHWNWHNVIGIWAAMPLLVISLTGVIMSHQWANTLLFRAMGETPPAVRGDGRMGRGPDGDARRFNRNGTAQRRVNLGGVDDLWALAESRAKPGWTTMSLRLGGGRGGDSDNDNGESGRGSGGGRGGVSFTFNYAGGGEGVPLGRVTMVFDRETGDLLSTDTFASESPGRRLRELIVSIHRGEILGIPGMAIAALSAVAALVMVYTGFALAWRRLVRPILTRRDEGIVRGEMQIFPGQPGS